MSLYGPEAAAARLSRPYRAVTERGAPAAAPPATTSDAAAARYFEVLADLDRRAKMLQGAIEVARHAGPSKRTAALVMVHSRARDVAALLNRVLGGNDACK